MKRFLFFILFLIATVITSDAKTVKFVQVTDIHYQESNAEQLENFVQEINQNHKDIDFVVFTGDNIDKSEPTDLYNFLEIIKHIKKKSYILVGNHDLAETKNMSSKNYMYLVRKRLGFYHSSKTNYVIKKGKLVFIAMNGVKEYFPGPNGYYQKKELLWLDKTLSKYPNKKIVILQHFPLVDTKHVTANLWQKEDYIKVISKYDNIIAVISGHYHGNCEVEYKHIYNIITKAFKNSGAYKIIEIDDETGFIYTSLIE